MGVWWVVGCGASQSRARHPLPQHKTAAMRAHTRAIAPALPLAYALRLWWTEPRVLLAVNSTTRRWPAFGGPTQQMSSKRCRTAVVETSQPRAPRLLPWAHALPLDEPVNRPRRWPRVLENTRNDAGLDFTFSGELSDAEVYQYDILLLCTCISVVHVYVRVYTSSICRLLYIHMILLYTQQQ